MGQSLLSPRGTQQGNCPKTMSCPTNNYQVSRSYLRHNNVAAMGLSPGPFTFLEDRLVEVLREGQIKRGTRPNHNDNVFRYYESDGSSLAARQSARYFALKLYSTAQDPRSHLTQLDACFDRIIYLTRFSKSALSESTVSFPSLMQASPNTARKFDPLTRAC